VTAQNEPERRRGAEQDRGRGAGQDHAHGARQDHAHGAGRDRASRHIVRRATLYSIAFLAAGLAIAVAGAALVAWMLGRAGLPFMRTWLILSVLIVLPGLLATVWKLIRGR
jgi:hypothetical protein